MLGKTMPSIVVNGVTYQLPLDDNQSTKVPEYNAAIIALAGVVPSSVNNQTGTTYTYLNSDRTKLVTHSNASAIAASLPQAGASSQFVSGWFMFVENRGAGTLTITPTTSTIDGAASLALTQHQGVLIVSDGTNYFTMRGVGGGSGAPADATYIVQTPSASLSNEQALSSLATGYMKVTTGTGVVSSQAVPIPVADGGTGASTLTANNVILGNGTSAPSFVAPGTSGNVLTSNGTTWTSAASAAGGSTQGLRCHNSSNIALNTGSTTVTFDTDDSDASGMHDTGANTDRLVAKQNGWATIIFNYEISAADLGGYVTITDSAGNFLAVNTLSRIRDSISTGINVATNDYFKIVFSTSTNLTLNAQARWSPYAVMMVNP